MDDSQICESSVAVQDQVPSSPQPASSPGRESGEYVRDDPGLNSDPGSNFLLEITYSKAPDWLQSEIERLIAACNRRSSTSENRHSADLRTVKYLSDFCIDTIGADERIRSSTRYDVVNRVPLPARPLQSQTCFNCGESGHSVKECPHPREPDIIRENVRLFKASHTPKTEPSHARYYHERPALDNQGSKRPRQDKTDRPEDHRSTYWQARSYDDRDYHYNRNSRSYSEANRRKSDSYRY